ncbi:hypothetical protein ACFX12_047005 [Malus domestica]
MTPTQVSDEETNLFAMQLANALTLHMVLKTALELDLLEIMTKAGPGAFFSLANLASQLPTKNPNNPVMLDRMLRLLANYSIFTYSICTLPNGNPARSNGFPKPQKVFIPKNPDHNNLIPREPNPNSTLSTSLWQSLSKQLGANEGGLDALELQKVVDVLNRKLSRLLKLNPKEFWGQVASDASDPGAHLADILSPKDHEVLLQEKKLLDLPTLLSEWGKDCCCLWWSFNFSAGKVSSPTTIHRRR